MANCFISSHVAGYELLARYLITRKVPKKMPGPVISTVWKATFSSFRNAMFQNLVDLVFWEKQFWPFSHPEWNSDVKKWLFSWVFFKTVVCISSSKPVFFSMTGKKVMKWMSNGFSLCRVWYLMRINHWFVRFSFAIDVEALYSFLLLESLLQIWCRGFLIW